MAEERIRILIVDDHTLVRAGIRMLLATIANAEVVAEASDGAEVVPLISIRRRRSSRPTRT